MNDSPEHNVLVLFANEHLDVTWTCFGPGERGAEPHVHREHTDAFYVLEGELTFELGPQSEKFRMGPGGYVAIPPRVGHSFANESEADARWLNLHAPECGFADFLRTLRDGTPGQWDSFDMPADGGLSPSHAIMSPPGEGERLVTGRRAVLIKGDTGDLCVAEWELDGPYAGPPVHHHERQVDAFYIVEGKLEMTMHGASDVFGAGELAAVPRGVDHTFNHRADEPGRVLNVHAPNAGFADVLRRMAD